MAKLLKLRRGTTTQHGSFTGAEGEVTIDTVKDTAVVHDGSTAGGHALAKENMANVSSASIAARFSDDAISPSIIGGGTLGTDVKIADGNINGNLTIENADVTSTAAIAGTKISPNFGSQNIATTGGATISGSLNSGDVTLTSTQPKIVFNDSNDNPDYQIENVQGVFKIRDNTNSTDRLVVNTDGHIDVAGRIDAAGGVAVTGNITATGTVDGRDVAADGTKLDAITTGNAGEIPGTAALANGVTAATQSAGDSTTKVATTAFVSTAVSNLVDSSPSALNTLNELAAAINDDASFSTTVNNNIATKMPLAGGEFTGNVTCENITPDGDSSRNLGTNSVRFANVYADNFVGSGANLTGVESFVSGMIILWSGSVANIPSGFVLCNGSNSTPDLRNRFVVGAGSSYNPGNTGGAANVTLSTAQIPSHSHTTNNHTHSFNAGSHTHSFSGSGSSSHNHSIYQYNGGNNAARDFVRHNGGIYANNNVTTNNTTVSISVSGNTGNAGVAGNTGNSAPSTNNTGSGNDHENRPPYYALCYIMKT